MQLEGIHFHGANSLHLWKVVFSVPPPCFQFRVRGLILKNARARLAPGFVFAHDQIRKLEEAGGKLNFPFADG